MTGCIVVNHIASGLFLSDCTFGDLRNLIFHFLPVLSLCVSTSMFCPCRSAALLSGDPFLHSTGCAACWHDIRYVSIICSIFTVSDILF